MRLAVVVAISLSVISLGLLVWYINSASSGVDESRRYSQREYFKRELDQLKSEMDHERIERENFNREQEQFRRWLER